MTHESHESAKSELSACPNCGAAREGEWCHACGQRNRRSRLTLKTIFADVLDHIFNVDSRLVMTLKGMTLRPGRTARDYVTGRRARYANPLRYCFAWVALYFLVRGYFGIGILDDVPEVLEVTAEGSKQEALQQHVAQQIGRVVDWVAIGAAPILALVMRMFFRTPQTNFAERLALTFFLQGHSHLYGLLLLPLVAIDASFGGTVRLAVQVIFAVWAIASFYGQGGLWAWLRAFLCWFLTVVVVGITGTIAAIPFIISAAKDLGFTGATP